MPEDVARAARDAFDSGAPSELAVLVYDSLVDADEVSEKHSLRFEHHRLQLALHVSAEPAGTVIQGVLDRTGPTRAALYARGSDIATVAPVAGVTFEFCEAAHGMVRLSLQADDQSPVWTDWFRI